MAPGAERRETMKQAHREGETTLLDPAPGPPRSTPGVVVDSSLGNPASNSGVGPAELPFTDLGNYRLVSWIGGGGMGQVFLAEHRQLKRKVALKILRRELANTPDVVRRFVSEAQLVNQIKNEHIVDITDFGKGPDGLEYFVMELLEGRDLDTARRDDGPFTLVRTLDIVRQIGSALAAVHARKVIHRDLKPENIYLVDREGRHDFVKLLDFGLAKLTETGSEGPQKDGTALGTVLGTPLYMSPEQAAGLRLDWRTDIYSLGLVMYWMLFDALPHDADSVEQIRNNRMLRPVPPPPVQTAGKEAVPPAVTAVLMGCLARHAKDRIQTVDEVLSKLPEPPPLRVPRGAPTYGLVEGTRGTRWRRAAGASLGVLLALALTAGGVWFLGRRRAGGDVAIDLRAATRPAAPLPALPAVPAGAPPPVAPAPAVAAPPPPAIEAKAHPSRVSRRRHAFRRVAEPAPGAAYEQRHGLADPFGE